MSSQALPPLLTIPLELRLKIYETVLNKWLPHQSKYFLCILSTCRQIRRETLPIVFQDSRYFRDLEKFTQWIEAGEPYLLSMVKDVTIHIFDPSLSALAECKASLIAKHRSQVEPFTGAWWELKYQQQLKTSQPDAVEDLSQGLEVTHVSPVDAPPLEDSKSAISSVWNALKAINKVKKLWILLKGSYGASTTRTFLVEQKLMLDMIAAGCEELTHFAFFSSLLPLEPLRNMHNLRLLRFSGYSASSPEETLDIFQSLKNLDTLEIYRYPEFYDKDYNITTSELTSHISVTPEVVKHMNALKSFKISHMTSRVPSHHFTLPMIKALHSHLETLITLHITSSCHIVGELFEELLNFVASSKIRDLELRFNVPRQKYENWDLKPFFPRSVTYRKASLAKIPEPTPTLGHSPQTYEDKSVKFSMSASAPLPLIHQ